ncbi:hypothetical protein [Anaerolinea sp.]|uniref:hypothetical protein n=1 Tax=Anaerolinea sp. TaxID=1872519 RepID=UPI002ACE24DA|nr:hypothetical protein [Anaerolinea sp.]
MIQPAFFPTLPPEVEDMDIESLCSALESIRRPLVQAIFADLYRNPFWEDRYGETGIVHISRDLDQHLDYLLTAVRLRSPEYLTEYFRWVRHSIILRGMCTRHLEQVLESLASHTGAMLPLETSQALSVFLDAARASLSYNHFACRSLSPTIDFIATQVAAHIYPDEAQAARRELCRRDILIHLSYLMDAVEKANPEIFFGYLEWLRAFDRKYGISTRKLVLTFSEMHRQIVQHLGEETAQPFTHILTHLPVLNGKPAAAQSNGGYRSE